MAHFKTVVITFPFGCVEVIPDVHESRVLSSLIQEIRTRKEIAVTSFVHLGYRRPVGLVHRDSSDGETEVVWLAPSTTVAEAFNLLVEVSSFALSQYVDMFPLIICTFVFQNTPSTVQGLHNILPLEGYIWNVSAAPPA